MERFSPAIAVRWPTPPTPDLVDALVAAVDEAGPTAVEEQPSLLRVFFSTDADRDRAIPLARCAAPDADVVGISVSDEAWAERSQAALGAVQIGRILVRPPWSLAPPPGPTDMVVTILPSMGFGTGHHATTRLCLDLLQRSNLAGCTALDVGTGSGVLAIAMWRLGADRVRAIDTDADALQSARENVEYNAAAGHVDLEQRDLGAAWSGRPPAFDVVTANLTAAALERYAGTLASFVAPGGALIVSGFQDADEPAVRGAFSQARLSVVERGAEDGWLAMSLGRATDSPIEDTRQTQPHALHKAVSATTGAVSARSVRGPRPSV